MKQIFTFIIIFLSGLGMAFAQDQPGDEIKREQKIKALYVAYITQELKMSEEEAQKFWPVHAQFDNELRSVDLNMPELERQQSVLNVKKKYQDRFIKILGNHRTNDFYRKDSEFRKKLVERLKRNRQENNMNRRPPAMRRNQ